MILNHAHRVSRWGRSLATVAMCGLSAAVLAAPQIAQAETFEISGTKTTLSAEVVADFNGPWAMTFLPDDTMLVTEQRGRMFHVTRDGAKTAVSGVPQVRAGGQGGLGDVVLHPEFAANQLVYLSYVERGEGGRGAVVVRMRLAGIDAGAPELTDLERIWTQTPKKRSGRHFSHRLLFDRDGMLFITSGDRGEQTPAQDFQQALGKLIRLNADGSVPADNPFQDRGELAKSYWSVGHRNQLGIALDAQGRIWAHEMGPRHGDELNLIVRGENYGWPTVSNGDNYSGRPIPDHNTQPQFEKPKAYWVPAISPAGLIIYSGDTFADWQGDALIGGLSSQALVRVDIDDTAATEAERFTWGARVREVEQGPDGAIWVLEDGGRLLRLTPATN